MSDLPLISCLMPTCGKCPNLQHLIEEAIEGFCRQTYPNKELLILNDCNGQTLTCNSPGVRIINTSDRAPTLGEKYNRMVEMAKGSILAPFEDDDISLPHRLSLSVERMGEGEAFNPRSYFFLNGSHFAYEQNTGIAHNCSIYRKSAWAKVGGYPRDCKQDAGFDSLLRRHCRVVDGPLPVELGVFIYRWGVGPHLSGNPNPERAWHDYGQQRRAQGVFHLVPHFRQDYEAMARRLATPSS